jgi:hydroxyacylglutathione hydrolase
MAIQTKQKIIQTPFFMNKILKRVLIGLGIIVGLLLLVSIGFFLKFKSATKDMHVIETGKIVDGVYAVKDTFVNMFLIQDNDQYVAVDAGNSSKNIAAELNKLNINPEKVIAVFLTHTDADHVAGLKLFPNAKVYISRPEEQMINGKKSKMLFFGNHVYQNRYNFIEDKVVMHIGNISIYGILTPGHTPGSMCYIVNDKLLFTGDALKLKDGKIAEMTHFFNMDSKEAKISIGKITNLPGVEYLFTAHFGVAGYQNAVKDWKE